jgi:soluble lytic murein transglycosylase-like protein
MPADLKGLFADPNFRKLGVEEEKGPNKGRSKKVALLEQYLPEFRDLSPKQKADFIQMGLYPESHAAGARLEREEAEQKRPGQGYWKTTWEQVKSIPGALLEAGAHPQRTAEYLSGQQQLEEAKKRAQRGDIVGAVQQYFSSTPVVGPMMGPAAVEIGEDIRAGRKREAAAKATALFGPEALEPIAKIPVVGRTLGKVRELFPGPKELMERGRKIAGEVAPSGFDRYGSGQAVVTKLTDTIEHGKTLADRQYEGIRQDVAAAKQTVQTGTKTSPILDPSGRPIQTPITSVFEAPVDLEPMRQSLAPIYEELTNSLPPARRASSLGYQALDNLMTGKSRYMDALDFDRTLSAVKGYLRDGNSPLLSNKSQGIAKQFIQAGEKELDTALGKVSPQLKGRLNAARATVKGYHAIDELLQSVKYDKPAVVFRQLLSPRDENLDTLLNIQKVAPAEVKTIGRTALEGMVEAKDFKAWKRLGPRTKQLLYGPQVTKDLDTLFGKLESLPAAQKGVLAKLIEHGKWGLGASAVTWLLTPTHSLHATAAVGSAIEMAHLLATPGTARLITRLVTSPLTSTNVRAGMVAINARAQLAAQQERRDRRAAEPPPAEAAQPQAATPAPAVVPRQSAVTAPAPAPGARAAAYGTRAAATSPPIAKPSPQGPPSELNQMLDTAARNQQLSPRVLHTVATLESSHTLHPPTSSAGAVGPMQMLPSTAQQYGATRPKDPRQNIDASARHLKHLWRKYRGNMELVLAAYNAGEGAVDKYGGVPPFRETEDYVRRGMALWHRAA